MKYLLSFFLLSTSLFAFTSVPEELKNEVAMIQSFPETRALVQSLEQEGPITLRYLEIKAGFNAFWASEKRVIAINSAKRWSPGEKLYSLLFELQNANADKQLKRLDELASQGQIAKQDYVESVEKAEYQNVVKTSQLLRRGIEQGYFPRGMSIPFYPNLQDHLYMQKVSGHSGAIAGKYDDLSPKGKG